MIKIEEDKILDQHRDKRTQGRVLVALGEHFQRVHADLAMTASNSVGEFYLWQLLIQCTSTDPRLAQWSEDLRLHLADITRPAKTPAGKIITPE